MDAGIEPRTVATSALAFRRCDHSAKSHPWEDKSLIELSYLLLPGGVGESTAGGSEGGGGKPASVTLSYLNQSNFLIFWGHQIWILAASNGTEV